MRRVFHDPQLEADFDEYGFVVVPFLDDAAIEELTQLYWEVGPAPEDPRTTMFFDFQSQDAGFKRTMVNRLRPVLEPRFKDLLDDYHLFYPNYIMKWTGERSGFAPHQDTSLVDEDRFKSITIWSPLTDTMLPDGRDNGMLYVVPGSHRFVSWIRAHDPGSFVFPGTEAAIIERFGVGVTVRAGEAIVFDHRLVHFSMPNESTEPRLVIALGLQPADAQLTHFRRRDDDGTFDAYAIDDDYFVDLNPFSVREGVPGYEQIGVVERPRPQVTLEEFAELCRAVGPGPRSASDRLVHDAHRPDRVNADPFCFRCGATDGLTGIERGEHGNVQFLCPTCRALETGSQTDSQTDSAPAGATLRDAEANERLERLGYAVVDVPPSLLDELGSLYRSTRPDHLEGFHATTQSDLPNLKRAVHEGVCRLADEVLDTWFTGHRAVAGNFVVKQPGPYTVEAHQDLDFVDEHRHRAVVMWVPLEAAGTADGCLFVVPGSHQLPTVPRGSGEHRLPFARIADHLRDEVSVQVPVERGQGVVYDARLLHGSLPNEGESERVAAAWAVLPQGVPLRHHHLNPDRTVAVIEADDEVYADTRFHGFPVRGRIVAVEELPEQDDWDAPTFDAALRERGFDVDGWRRSPETPKAEAADPPPTAGGKPSLPSAPASDAGAAGRSRRWARRRARTS